jgi:hypothetical protein
MEELKEQESNKSNPIPLQDQGNQEEHKIYYEREPNLSSSDNLIHPNQEDSDNEIAVFTPLNLEDGIVMEQDSIDIDLVDIDV